MDIDDIGQQDENSIGSKLVERFSIIDWSWLWTFHANRPRGFAAASPMPNQIHQTIIRSTRLYFALPQEHYPYYKITPTYVLYACALSSHRVKEIIRSRDKTRNYLKIIKYLRENIFL